MKEYFSSLILFCRKHPFEASLIFIAGWCIGLIIQ